MLGVVLTAPEAFSLFPPPVMWSRACCVEVPVSLLPGLHGCQDSCQGGAVCGRATSLR